MSKPPGLLVRISGSNSGPDDAAATSRATTQQKHRKPHQKETPAGTADQRADGRCPQKTVITEYRAKVRSAGTSNSSRINDSVSMASALRGNTSNARVRIKHIAEVEKTRPSNRGHPKIAAAPISSSLRRPMRHQGVPMV